MKDINFFEPYIEKHEFKFNKIYLLYSILVLYLIGIIIFSISNQLHINKLQDEVAQRRAIAEDSLNVKNAEEIKTLQEEVNTFKDEVKRIVELDKTIESKDIISEELLKQIKSKMPEDLFLSNFSAFDREIQISGVAQDTYSIAEFGKGLELIEEADSVFVSNITNIENYYNFVLNLSLKDVTIDGNQPIQEE